MDVYVTEMRWIGPKPWLYQVWVDGEVYDAFNSARPLSEADQFDVAAGYREALEPSLTLAG